MRSGLFLITYKISITRVLIFLNLKNQYLTTTYQANSQTLQMHSLYKFDNNIFHCGARFLL